MAQYLWGRLAPWIEEDIESIVRANSTAALSKEPYIGLHIRRGDKVSKGEAKYIDTEVGGTDGGGRGVVLALPGSGRVAWWSLAHRSVPLLAESLTDVCSAEAGHGLAPA